MNMIHIFWPISSERKPTFVDLQEKKKLREAVPENDIASLQEELAAAKLREAESGLALKDLKAKVAELNTMWKKHLQQRAAENNSESSGNGSASASVVPSTPKKLLGKNSVKNSEKHFASAKLSVIICC